MDRPLCEIKSGWAIHKPPNCPWCRIAELEAERDQLRQQCAELEQQCAELEASKKSDCIAFAQWFRQGSNRRGRTEDECYGLWLGEGE